MDSQSLYEGCVIGSDGFGYIRDSGKHERLPQVGIVEAAAEVEIGANSTIDRARMGSTYIGEGTKVDKVQIAHNVKIGKCCLLISQSGSQAVLYWKIMLFWQGKAEFQDI